MYNYYKSNTFLQLLLQQYLIFSKDTHIKQQIEKIVYADSPVYRLL